MSKTVYFHHPLEEIDPDTGQPYLQAPCGDPEACDHEQHAAVEVVGRHAEIVRACPDGHRVDRLVVHALTPVASLGEERCGQPLDGGSCGKALVDQG